MKKILKSLLGLILTFIIAFNPILSVWASNNSEQIVSHGGETSNEKDGITVSKIISPSSLENYFDITLTVKAKEKAVEPDLAVVIVLDISNTMTEALGSSTRLAEAKKASYEFIDKFAKQSNDNIERKLGFVAFNSDSYSIFDLQDCNANNKKSLKSTIEKGISKNIVTKIEPHNKRFTNIESGLKRANDMLSKSSASKKFILFLSDGFPTTYIKDGSQYQGYDTYDGNRFKDIVLNKSCYYGNSYSDEAAIRARKMATTIKNSGIEIYSVGVGIGGQTIKKYIDQTNGKNYAVVDRTSEIYEIGSATSDEAYKNWLKNSIGSGHYYDVDNQTAMLDAFNSIFQQIMILSEATWVTEDPMNNSKTSKTIGFIGIYGENNVLSNSVTKTSNYPNTATFDTSNDTIKWDLKNSIPTYENNKYTYTLKYRVRLKNELTDFIVGNAYETNGKTSLNYVVKENNKSREGEIDFKIPKVEGYLGTLEFAKKSNYKDQIVSGAVFELVHADDCPCLNERKHMNANFKLTSTSNSNGKVTFNNIPSGHTYKLKEVKTDDYHTLNETIYDVNVSYGKTIHNIENSTVINNINTKDLVIVKEVKNITTNKSFDFEINATYKEEKINGTYQVIRTTNGRDTNEEITFVDGVATFKLKHNESITIKELPIKINFNIKELNIDGFNVKYQVNDGNIRKFNDKELENNTLEDNMKIKFINSSGYVMPGTGSSGMLILAIIGTLLLLIPILYISVNILKKD